MPRDPWKAVKEAHDALHAGNVEEAHEALHAAGAGSAEWPPVECLTHNAEAQKAVGEFIESLKRPLPTCAHTLGDLIGGGGAVTKCGRCILERRPSNGAGMIAAERARQILVEGWTPEHDDEHGDGELAIAAACYASPVPLRAEIQVPCGCRSVGECSHVFGPSVWGDPWPWDPPGTSGRKKHDRIQQLAVAGALIAAEIDRLQRAKEASHGA